MRLVPALTVCSLFVCACTSGEKNAAGTAAATPAVVTYHAKDFAYTGPDSISAGMTELRLVNDGMTLHHMQLVRLDSGKTLADLNEALKKPGMPPMWAVFVPGPNAPDPGTQSNATVDLAAGNYAIICLVDIPGHVPHFVKGMQKALTVTAAKGPAIAAPVAQVSITVSDYSFALSKPLVAGKQTVAVVGKGPQPHEVEIIRFDPGKTMKDLGAWMEKPEGPPPAHGVGGVSATLPGVTAYFTVDLPPGDYVLVCFLPDGKDGKMHMEHGMLQPFKIT
ncbi:MAG: hypothetical protein ACHQQ3_03980 [Gemmatimonadales bacterium]